MSEDITIEDVGYVEDIRGRLGLESDDTSMDAEILAMSPMDRVRKIVAWNLGSEDWADTFHSWLESQGIYLTTDPDADGVIHQD